ncbi:purine-nucleoside phosphorylase [Rubricoccus marinus]|uniref:Purine nucleoside phosphorylase n=1 Tax=Rubricoccus marinus TaxID=716817 RepID=A0A259TZ41_9BACT|nr:purine-nucleoside phosphorylase [Rubricoccus marinus]OZC03043.1 purine-nucleoside phosphorylase [Rubricoccus marinus]
MSVLSSDDLTRPVHTATESLRQTLGDHSARIGLILGTGLGRLAEEIEVSHSIGYEEIPDMPVSTVESHHGKLLAGTLRGVPVLAMQGRFHLYEGYSAHEITRPVRILKELGVDTLLISNAAGGMNPLYRRADLMLLTDHINLQGVNPLTGPNVDTWGPRFPDMSEPYDLDLRDMAEAAALARGIRLQQGVYVAVEGPNLETRAEYRFLRTIGADAVGMSTVPEVIVAKHMGLRCMAISVITDECFPDALEPVSIADVLKAAGEAEPRLTQLIGDVVEKIGAE